MLHSVTDSAGFGIFKISEGRMGLEATFPPMAPSHESPQAVVSTHMSEGTILILLALLCTVICLSVLASIVPWAHYIWRSRRDHTANRVANTGMKEKSIEALPSINYGKSMVGFATECAICLAEFVEGEGMRVLPSCNHGFHKDCVDKWLRSQSSCPTCRHCPLDPGCQKVANHIQPTKSDPREAQTHQPRASQEPDEIIDLECGLKR